MVVSRIISSSSRWNDPVWWDYTLKFMPHACILTDNTAQFTRHTFPGKENVYVVPLALERIVEPGEVPMLDTPELRLLHPSAQDFNRHFKELSQKYDSILVLTLSSQLFPLDSYALAEAAQSHNHVEIEVMDSRTTSIGLGWLVEQAASAAQAGESCQKIIKLVQRASAGIYFLFFIPDLGALVNTRHLTPTQAMAAAMLEMLPIFMLEDGRLAPLEKAHSPRAVIEYFEEFLDEFEFPGRVALVHGSGQEAGRLSQLRQHIQTAHPLAQSTEHAFTPELELLLGRRGLGMAIMQRG